MRLSSVTAVDRVSRRRTSSKEQSSTFTAPSTCTHQDRRLERGIRCGKEDRPVGRGMKRGRRGCWRRTGTAGAWRTEKRRSRCLMLPRASRVSSGRREKSTQRILHCLPTSNLVDMLLLVLLMLLLKQRRQQVGLEQNLVEGREQIEVTWRSGTRFKNRREDLGRRLEDEEHLELDAGEVRAGKKSHQVEARFDNQAKQKGVIRVSGRNDDEMPGKKLNRDGRFVQRTKGKSVV